MAEKYTLRQIRSIRGLTQEQLAKLANVSTRTIANYERDVTSFQNADYIVVYNIAKALGVRTSDIFLGVDSEKPKQGIY